MILTSQTSTILRMSMQIGFGIASLALSQASTAYADDSKPDKSGYTLFNPTPDSAQRDFSTDRPTKSFVPTTIDAGHVMLEVEAFNFTTQKLAGVSTQTYVGPNPTARIGLTNNVEFQLNFTPFVFQHAYDSNIGMSSNGSGVSDVFARAKINLWGNEGGRTALAIIPYVKFGTSPTSVGGNQATEGGIIVPYSVSLPNKLTLLINGEWDQLKNMNDGNYHSQYASTVNLSGSIAKDVTLYGEIATQINVDPAHTSHRYTFDTALTWAAEKNLQFDIGANIGLNKEAPALQIYTGISRRF